MAARKFPSCFILPVHVQLLPYKITIYLRVSDFCLLNFSIVNVHSVQEEKAKSFVAKKAEMFPKKVEVVEPKTVNDLAAQVRG